jgi:hypothetical protein
VPRRVSPLRQANIGLENRPEPDYNLWIIARIAGEPIKRTNGTVSPTRLSTGYHGIQAVDLILFYRVIPQSGRHLLAIVWFNQCN